MISKLTPFLNKHLESLTEIPNELKGYVHTADSGIPVDKESTKPWFLAHRIVVSAIENDALQDDLTALLTLVQSALQEKQVLRYILEIAERLFDIISVVLAEPELINLFTEENALITIYFSLIFFICCAHAKDENNDGIVDESTMIANIHEHEELWIRLARLANTLLLNQQIHEFVSDVREGDCSGIVGRIKKAIKC